MDIGIIYLAVAFILLILSAAKDIKKTKQAIKATGKIALTVFPVLFLIFIGEVVGSFALIQPAAVFPFAGVLHDRGASYGALLGFVMTAILIGVSTLPLEIKLFGKSFALTRNILTFVFVFLIGIVFMLIL